jgi:hypothetical protein
VNAFTVVRTPLQILADLGAVLTGSTRLPSLMDEMVQNQNVREDIIRDRLAVHKVPQQVIDIIVEQYKQAKAAS